MTKMGLTKKLLKLMSIPQKVEYDMIWFKTREDYDKTTRGRREAKIIKYLKSRNTKLTEDSVWNLYLINKDTPLICSHLDTVWGAEAQKLVHKIRLYKTGERIGRQNEQWQEIINNLQSSVIVWQENIWADDKCGIALAMELYEQLGDKISLLFTVWEESGCIWINHFVKENEALLKDITYAIIPDRKGSSDIICKCNDYGSELFDTAIMGHLWMFWFKSVVWLYSDCDTICDYINCFNISCGYYEPHTHKEYVVVDELENTYNTILYLINNYNERLEKPTKHHSYYDTPYEYYEREKDYYKKTGEDYNDYKNPIEYDWEIMYVNRTVELYWNWGKQIVIPAGKYYIASDNNRATSKEGYDDDDWMMENEKIEQMEKEFNYG